VKDAHARREQDRPAGHRHAAREDQVLRGTDLDEGAEPLVRRAPHDQVAGEREPHRSLRGFGEELAEHHELLRAGDGRVRVGVPDRTADQVATGFRAANDLLDPVGRGIGVAVDEGEDVSPGHRDARGAGPRRQGALRELHRARRRQRPGRDRTGVVVARVHDDDLEEMRGLLRSEGFHASGDGARGVQRRHDHRDARRA
jgi:hypothetical protein